uniref:Nucleocapsid protein n=1 Tax=Phasmatodean orthomyxo-related virus OKIAV167 TaxID=2746280 RepID=A0A7D7F1E9_9ORTO|nr:nucleocapsid protein [Phasmatodean orthomyxo-related virus OKIAV167]
MSEPAAKRIRLVDPDHPEREVPKAGRANLELDPVQRAVCVLFIWEAYTRLKTSIFTALHDPAHTDIHLANTIMSVLRSAHNALRQQYNNSGNLPAIVADANMSINSGGEIKTIRGSVAKRIVKESAETHGLVYGRPAAGDTRHWYGTVAPILTFFSINGARVDEIRLGHSHMTVTKQGGVKKVAAVASYGIHEAHFPLCGGMSMNPGLRSSMAQSCGILTAAVMIARSSNPVFARKWKDSLIRSGFHIPFITEIAELLFNRTAPEVAGIITALGNLMLAITPRNFTRATPPFNFFLRVLCDESVVIPEREVPMETDAGPSTVKAIKIPSRYIAAEGDTPEVTSWKKTCRRAILLADGLDFSGRGLFWFYRLSSKYEYQMPFAPGTDPKVARQVCFHSIFDSWREDLGLLASISNEPYWLSRREMGKAFIGRGASAAAVKFTPVHLKAYARLAGASMTNYLAGTAGQIIAVPAFSGVREVQYTDAFLQVLQTGTPQASMALTNPMQVQAALLHLSRRVAETIREQGGKGMVGTATWKRIEEVSPSKDGSDYNGLVVTTNKFFFGGTEDL